MRSKQPRLANAWALCSAGFTLMIGRLARRPLLRLYIRVTRIDDPWKRGTDHLGWGTPLHVFGSRARDFNSYFEGESGVPAATLHNVRHWLAGCEHESDPLLSHTPDFRWRHPSTFEQLRRGDCADFALWGVAQARRTRLRRGSGHRPIRPHRPERQSPPCLDSLSSRGGVEYLYDPASREPVQALLPLDAVKSEYIPTFGVGPDRKPFDFDGYLYFMKYLLKNSPEEILRKHRRSALLAGLTLGILVGIIAGGPYIRALRHTDVPPLPVAVRR